MNQTILMIASFAACRILQSQGASQRMQLADCHQIGGMNVTIGRGLSSLLEQEAES